MDIEERNKLVEENINLVYYIVHKYFNYGDTEEFIGEGFIGLIRAANTYDETKKIKFSTFAHTCIYYEICRSLNRQQCDCRKANLNTVSIDNTITDSEDLVYKDVFKYSEDYSVLSVSYLLDIIDRFKIKDARFICVKRLEGYNFNEIGDMLSVSSETVKYRIYKIRDKLIKLGVAA